MKIKHGRTAQGMHYVVSGKGSPLVLIPGLGATWQMYRPQLCSLAQKHTVLTLDLRGNGTSPQLKGPASTVLQRQASDVVGVLDELRIDSAHVAGISYGGIIVQQLGMAYPDRFRSLVICDSFADTTPRSFVERVNMMGADQTAILRWSGATRRAVLGPAIAWQYRRWPAAKEEMLEVVGSERGDELALQRAAINHINNIADLRKIDVPVLCLVGGSSHMLISRMKQLAQAVPHAVFRIIPNSFDPSNLCNQRAFDSLVAQFLMCVDAQSDSSF